MNYKSTVYASYDGMKLSGYLWKPEEEPKALINLVHGFGEYMERYDHWAMRFVEQGYVVHSIDNRGHGKSDGKRGHVRNHEEFLKDIDVLIKESSRLYPKLDQFIYGHSMGGNIVANYILKRDVNFKGAILSSPWLKLSFSPSALTIFFARIIQKLFPKFTKESDLDVKGISHDPGVVDAYIKDPLIHGKITAKMFFEIYNAGLWAISNSGKLNIPVLIQHGTGDNITSHKASKEFYQNAKEKDIIYKEWDGLYHELHNETEKDKIFEFVHEWIDKKLQN